MKRRSQSVTRIDFPKQQRHSHCKIHLCYCDDRIHCHDLFMAATMAQPNAQFASSIKTHVPYSFRNKSHKKI